MTAKIKQEVFNDRTYGSNGDATHAYHLAGVPHLLEQTENKGENALPLSPGRHLCEIGIM